MLVTCLGFLIIKRLCANKVAGAVLCVTVKFTRIWAVTHCFGFVLQRSICFGENECRELIGFRVPEANEI